ncbi:MAG: DUF4397 domain-containing protein, partial [Calditrichaceae bacterium]
LQGGAATVFASGFFNPAVNQNGPAFGLFAALPNGAVVEFPALTTARLQVIHNAADPAADTVDIYLNEDLLLDNFAFRTATPFIDAPANQEITIGVAPGNSSSVEDVIADFDVTLTAGEKYVVVANGVLDPGSFAVNPDGESTAFTLLINNVAKEEAENAEKVDFFILHGATDAPSVNVDVRNTVNLTNNLSYGSFTDYITVDAADYILDISPAADSTMVLKTYNGALSALSGEAVSVLASGFFDPASNNDGPGFALIAVTAGGGVVTLSEYTTSDLQVIHNAADPAAETVDVYINGDLAVDNFAFRTATPFLEVAGNSDMEVAIAPPTSASAAEAIQTFDLRPLAGERYVVVANGVLNPENFAVNPDGRDIAFTLLVKSGIMESVDEGQVGFVVLHGSTDAPSVKVVARDVATLVPVAAYSDFSDDIIVPANAYSIDLENPGTSEVLLSYLADLSGLGGGTALVFASGFLTPADNQSGESFGLFAALPNGDVVEFGDITSIRNENVRVVERFALEQNYPNPFNPSTTIKFSIPSASFVTVTIYDILGKEVASLVNEYMQPGSYSYNFNGTNLASGIYLYKIDAGSFKSVKKMTLVK